MHHIGDAIGGHHHAALAYGFLVDSEDDAVGGDNLKFGIVVEHPFVDDVAQLVRVVAQHLAHQFRVVLVVVDYLLQGVGAHADAFTGTGDIL